MMNCSYDKKSFKTSFKENYHQDYILENKIRRKLAKFYLPINHIS